MNKKKVLIIGAMDRELKELLSYYKCTETEKLQSIYPIWHSSSDNPFELIVLQTHVGETNASISTTLAINSYNPDHVYKIGCVGGCSGKLHTGDIIMPLGFFSTTAWISRSSINNEPTADASVWQSIFGDKPYQVNSNNLGNQPYFFESDKILNEKYSALLQKKSQKFVPCFVGGGNMWFFDKGYAENASFEQIPGRSKDRIWAADMESYAIAQTCNVFNKPFTGFYRVSDNNFENEGYDPEKVAGLFDNEFILMIDEVFRGLSS